MATTQLKKAIEHYKVDSGKTSSEIADMLGVSRYTLDQKVQGITPINFKQAKTLADMLGMTLDELYTIAPKVER
jgi:transcriptional regulator with XRE-family HTH domain